METARTSGDEVAPVEAELLSDEELEHLWDAELVDSPLDEFADLLTASALRAMRRQRPA